MFNFLLQVPVAFSLPPSMQRANPMPPSSYKMPLSIELLPVQRFTERPNVSTYTKNNYSCMFFYEHNVSI